MEQTYFKFSMFRTIFAMLVCTAFLVGCGGGSSSSTDSDDSADRAVEEPENPDEPQDELPDTDPDPDTDEPSEPITAPQLNFIETPYGQVGEGRIIDNAIIFHGVAEPNSIVNLSLNGEHMGSTIANIEGGWMLDFRQVNLPPGAYNAELSCTSREGVEAQSESSFQFVYDPTPPGVPQIPSLISDSGVQSNDGITNVGDIVLQGVAPANVQIRIYLNGQFMASTETDEQGSWQHTFDEPLSDGSYQVEVSAVDYGLESALTDALSVQVDQVVPVVTGTSPANGAASVSVAESLQLSFSEPVYQGIGNVTLRYSDHSLARQIPVSSSEISGWGSSSLQINLNQDLDYSMSYYVQLNAGAVRDIAGNRNGAAMAPDFWAFSAEPAPPQNGAVLASSQRFYLDTTPNGAAVQNSVTNQPVLIRISDPAIIDSVQPGAPDIRVLDDDGVTELAYEVSRWDQSNNVAELWVLVPQVDGNSDQDFITLMYNDIEDGSVENGENPDAVWADYVGVYHFEEADQARDSSIYGNHGIEQGNVRSVSGFVGRAVSFTNNAAFAVPYSASLDMADRAFTVESWYQSNTCDTTILSSRLSLDMISRHDGQSGWVMSTAHFILDLFVILTRVDRAGFEVGDESGSTRTIGGSLPGVFIGDCVEHVVASYDPLLGTSLYINGTLRAQNNDRYNLEAGQVLTFGGHNSSYDLLLDEVRITRSVMNADKIQLNYQNQLDSSNFIYTR